ncbi:MAG: DNA-directed RNA polymerase subunit omega [Acidobacteriota bacterium]
MLDDSYYLFVEVAAHRCRQLMRGAKPKVDIRARKFTTIATEEVSQRLIPWEMAAEGEIDQREDADSRAVASAAEEASGEG